MNLGALPLQGFVYCDWAFFNEIKVDMPWNFVKSNGQLSSKF